MNIKITYYIPALDCICDQFHYKQYNEIEHDMYRNKMIEEDIYTSYFKSGKYWAFISSNTVTIDDIKLFIKTETKLPLSQIISGYNALTKTLFGEDNIYNKLLFNLPIFMV